jgi:hypothetical protein
MVDGSAGIFRREKGFPQGLKPIDSTGFIGTTEVVPFYKAAIKGVFP